MAEGISSPIFKKKKNHFLEQNKVFSSKTEFFRKLWARENTIIMKALTLNSPTSENDSEDNALQILIITKAVRLVIGCIDGISSINLKINSVL